MPNALSVPIVGVGTIWANPQELNPEDRVLIEKLRARYGHSGFTVRTVSSDEGGKYIVTLNKWGCLVMNGWHGEPLHPDPTKPVTPIPLYVEWHLLQPLPILGVATTRE